MTYYVTNLNKYSTLVTYQLYIIVNIYVYIDIRKCMNIILCTIYFIIYYKHILFYYANQFLEGIQYCRTIIDISGDAPVQRAAYAHDKMKSSS